MNVGTKASPIHPLLSISKSEEVLLVRTGRARIVWALTVHTEEGKGSWTYLNLNQPSFFYALNFYLYTSDFLASLA